jgi:hypothetical protein
VILGGGYIVGEALRRNFGDELGDFLSPLFAWANDPIVIDLDGDGIELTALGDRTTGSHVFFDYDGDGAVDAGEMQTLAEAGLASVGLTRTDVTRTNEGHGRGFSGVVTRANGTTTTAEKIYFQSDRQTTRSDNTPSFTPAAGVDLLPKLPGSGQINSMAWKLTQDAAFRTDWTALTDAAGTLSPDQLRSQFEGLLETRERRRRRSA